MKRRIAIAATALTLPLAIAATGAAADSSLQGTFVDIYSQCPTSPPTVVFCGSGNLVQFGSATSTVSLTGPLVPVPGTLCEAVSAVRQIVLDDGSGTLTLTESGTICPRSASANAQDNPYTVDKTYTITGGTGVFADATGSGTEITRSAGDEQVAHIDGSLSL